jgi:glycosyltransferase involved in cell wall biosynthesis
MNMKIAQVCAYFQPEFGYDEYYVSKNLAQMGHEVSVVTSDRIYPLKNVKKLLEEIGSEYTTRKRDLGKSKLNGFTVYRLPSAFEIFLDLNVMMNVRSTLKEIHPELVHCHEPILGGSALAAKHKDLGFKLVVDQHAYATTFEETETSKNKVVHYQYLLLRKRIANYALHRADAIVAVTERTKQFMVDVHKIPADKIEIVPLGVDENIFKFDTKVRARVRTELGLDDKTPLILTAGRLDRAKKMDQLIRAFEKVIKRENAQLIIIGTGDETIERELKELVKKLGLRKSVKFIEFVNKSKLAGYYSAADIGFWNKASITIIEAMGCRLPVVLPEQTTIKSYVSNQNGLLFPEDDIKALSERLYDMVVDPESRMKMGARAQELVEKKYSYKITTRKLLKIYKRCLEK